MTSDYEPPFATSAFVFYRRILVICGRRVPYFRLYLQLQSKRFFQVDEDFAWRANYFVTFR